MRVAFVYTGPIDAYFGYCYRQTALPVPTFRAPNIFRLSVTSRRTVNFPNDYDYTRITEFKHLTGQQHRRHIDRARISRRPKATPTIRCRAGERSAVQALRGARAEGSEVTFVGRLAQYRYYNMDQCVGAALKAADTCWRRWASRCAGASRACAVESAASAPPSNSAQRSMRRRLVTDCNT